MSSRFEKTDSYPRSGEPLVVTTYDWKAMGDAIEALEKRMDAAIHTASVASNAGAGMAERLKAIEEQVRLFNLRLDGHYERHVGLDERIDPLEDRVKAIAADLSRLEQRTAPSPQTRSDGGWQSRAEGVYAVQWWKDGQIAGATWNGIRWLEPKLGRPFGEWEMPVYERAPHWIGPRVDLPK